MKRLSGMWKRPKRDDYPQDTDAAIVVVVYFIFCAIFIIDIISKGG